MRPILMSIVFLAASAWSSVNLIWTEFQFEKGYLEVDTAKICNVDTTYINCSQDRGLAYYSTMDTTFAVLFNPLITRVQLFKSLNVDEQRQAAAGYDFKMTAVLRYEFMKCQEWGIIKITRDSAQRLLDRILPETRDVQGRKIIHKKVCDEEMLSACQGEILWGGSGSPSFSEEDMARHPQKKFLAESSTPVPADTSAKTPVGEQPTDSVVAQPNDSVGVTTPDSTDKPLFISRGAPVGGSLLGLRYSEFDVNGVFIRSGIWQGSLKATGSTRVVRFENGLTAVFR